MALHKTDLARDTLARNTGATLSLRERRVLILADGRRTLADLRLLLVGEDVGPLVTTLLVRGFLRDDASTLPAAAPATEPAIITAPAPPRNRRSLAAAKVYVSDQLQLQRDAAMAVHRDALHAARDEGALLVAMAAATLAMATRTSASVGERMRDRVREALPEALVARFDALCAQAPDDHAHCVRVA